MTRYMLYLMGHVVNENEMIWFVVNNGSPQMREEVEPVLMVISIESMMSGGLPMVGRAQIEMPTGVTRAPIIPVVIGQSG